MVGRQLDQTMTCIWLTGLSGSGKTTIALALKDVLAENGYNVEYLDGDIVRQSFTKDLGFSKIDRDENIKRVSYVASYLSSKPNTVVVCAFISPYKNAREKARDLIDDFVEAYVNCPLSVCESRDVKGLYKKARAGIIKGFTGIDDPYEQPDSPEIMINTDTTSIEECVTKIANYLGKSNGV